MDGSEGSHVRRPAVENARCLAGEILWKKSIFRRKQIHSEYLYIYNYIYSIYMLIVNIYTVYNLTMKKNGKRAVEKNTASSYSYVTIL